MPPCGRAQLHATLFSWMCIKLPMLLIELLDSMTLSTIPWDTIVSLSYSLRCLWLCGCKMEVCPLGMWHVYRGKKKKDSSCLCLGSVGTNIYTTTSSHFCFQTALPVSAVPSLSIPSHLQWFQPVGGLEINILHLQCEEATLTLPAHKFVRFLGNNWQKSVLP